MSGDEKSVEYAKILRGHIHINSTLHYIDFNIEAVEELSKMLFARGEFGYVFSLLIDKLNHGVTKSFKEKTEQIRDVSDAFGDVNKINTTIAFLNCIRSDKEVIKKYFSTMSFDECLQKANDLYAMNLPSKEGTDIQCLYSKNHCVHPNLECQECPYKISTIYSLSTLCDGLTHDMDMYNSTSNIAKRFKLSLKIHRKKNVLIEAIKRFGKDYIYGCLGLPRDKFLDKLSMIDDPTLL